MLFVTVTQHNAQIFFVTAYPDSIVTQLLFIQHGKMLGCLTETLIIFTVKGLLDLAVSQAIQNIGFV